MKSGIEIIIEHKRALYWMIADQTAEFDSYLLMPIRNRAEFVERIVSFLKYRLGVPPGTLSKTVDIKLRDILTELQAGGEDLDRLAFWLLSMKNTEKKLVQNDLARGVWSNGFYYWKKNGLQPNSCKHFQEASEVINSYIEQVITPWQEFRLKESASEINWLSGSENRSKVDNLLYEILYEGVGSCPSKGFALLYDTVMQRT